MLEIYQASLIRAIVSSSNPLFNLTWLRGSIREAVPFLDLLAHQFHGDLRRQIRFNFPDASPAIATRIGGHGLALNVQFSVANGTESGPAGGCVNGI
jgi:hypothetical protein